MFVLFILVIALIGYGLMVLMHSNRMDEIAQTLKLSNFSKKAAPDYAVCSGVYKNCKVSIKSFISFTPWKKDSFKTVYQVFHTSPFSADITPGDGLHDEDNKEKARIAKEESAKKVWNPNLSEEEKRIIEERKKTRASEDVVRDAIKITSARAVDVNKYLDENGRRKIVCDLFKKGAVSVCISRTEISLTVVGYGPSDIKQMDCLSYINAVKELSFVKE